MKIVIWSIVSIVIVLVLIVGIGMYMFDKEIKAEQPEYIIDFLKENAAKGNVAMVINYNDEHWVNINEKEPLPLASTVKIIVAIEYAQQAADGKIDPNQIISLEELDRFYIAKTDGGAHEAWLTEVQKEYEKEGVPLYEVANGMIAYSSNANTDYLIYRLGLENLNETLKKLELVHHDEIYPLTSPLYIPFQLMSEQSLSSKELLVAMQEMDMDEYRQRATAIHKNWLTEPLTEQEKEQVQKTLTMDIQKVWSDRLHRSTTKDYAAIMKKLNDKSYFSEEVYKYLDPVMEQLMQRPSNSELFAQLGQKGGSTAFVLTIAMYATDKEQNRTELAFFANDLSIWEQTKLAKNLNSFQLAFLTEEQFRVKVRSELVGL
ncbi:serine hydrolase [Metasolibacillus sp. FSL H7-0170]|uniref:serine hydrolase n=1 Tax=Metasolibacillus sp. FSL H7-0170 TaxID=2921431 RepID=UPI0031589AE3